MQITWDGIRKIVQHGILIVRKAGDREIEKMTEMGGWVTMSRSSTEELRDRYFKLLLGRDRVIEGVD